MSRLKKIDIFYENTLQIRIESSEKVDAEEERLQRDLTDEELNQILDDLYVKYNMKREC